LKAQEKSREERRVGEVMIGEKRGEDLLYVDLGHFQRSQKEINSHH